MCVVVLLLPAPSAAANAVNADAADEPIILVPRMGVDGAPIACALFVEICTNSTLIFHHFVNVKCKQSLIIGISKTFV